MNLSHTQTRLGAMQAGRRYIEDIATAAIGRAMLVNSDREAIIKELPKFTTVKLGQ